MAQGCTLSPTLFLIYVNGLLCEIEKCPKLDAQSSEYATSGLLFAHNFVGLVDSYCILVRRSFVYAVYMYLVSLNMHEGKEQGKNEGKKGKRKNERKRERKRERKKE